MCGINIKSIHNRKVKMTYNPKYYIDLAFLQGQLLSLLDQKNKLQELINEKELEVEKKKGEQDELDTIMESEAPSALITELDKKRQKVIGISWNTEPKAIEQ